MRSWLWKFNSWLGVFHMHISVFLTQITCFIYGNDVQVQAGFRKYTSHSIWILLLFLFNLLIFKFWGEYCYLNLLSFFKNNHVSLNNTTPSDFTGLLHLMYTTVVLFVCRISCVMKLVKLNHSTLADCIKEATVMVSAKVVYILWFFLFFFNVAKMR